MKPCPDKQKLIAWLALDALDAPSARELRAHLESCPGCQHYLAEMSQVTGQIAAAAPTDPLPASEKFHRQVMIKIKAEAATPFGTAVMRRAILDFLRTISFNWRVALPVAVVLIALLVAVIGPRPRSAATVHPPSAVAAPPMVVAAVDLAPTIANYRQVAGQSLEKLDALLIRQGNRAGGPAQVCTASAMTLNF